MTNRIWNCGCARWRWPVGLLLVFAVVSCSPDNFYNMTASLSAPRDADDTRPTPGTRADIQVAFVNNTPYRAIFTYGTYDPLNTEEDSPIRFTPQYAQFYVDPDAANRLEGNSESAVQTFTCGRAMSIGGEKLIELIREQKLDEGADENALEPGIAFSDKPVDDPEAGEPTAGTADGIVTLQGAEYPCGALLIYTFELESVDPNRFRIDLEVIMP